MESKAKESAQVKKYRRKLKKQMESENAQMNEAALRKVKETIQQWIARHQSERINLRDKTISLFDENRHSAQTESRFVQDLFNRIRHGARPKEEITLEGRVSEESPEKED